MGVIRDISEEKRLERMKEDLIGMITHDLRNPVLSLGEPCRSLLEGALDRSTGIRRVLWNWRC